MRLKYLLYCLPSIFGGIIAWEYGGIGVTLYVTGILSMAIIAPLFVQDILDEQNKKD